MIRIGLIGDYDPVRISHAATNAALNHSADYLDINLEFKWLPTESLENNLGRLNMFDGIWCAPGSPYKSVNGALNGIRFARENGVPFIGTCGGFQHAVIEYARNKLGLANAQHAEYDPNASGLVITPLSCSLAGEVRKVFLNKDSKAYAFYDATESLERFSCNFGIHPQYQKLIDESAFKIAGTDENGEARILELEGHPFYIATLFQPQLSSLPQKPHKLITAFLICSKNTAN